jgi:hypothetical protein
MAAAAAVVVLAGGGYEIAQHVGGSSTSRSSTAPAGGQTVNGPESAPAASGASPQRYYLRAGQENVPVVQSRTDYTPATLKAQVMSTLNQNGPLVRSGVSGLRSSGAGSSPEPFTKIPASTLAGCVTRIAAGQHVLLVDVASYEGTPAMLIVTGASATAPEQVWVVGTACSSADSHLLTHATLAPAG